MLYAIQFDAQGQPLAQFLYRLDSYEGFELPADQHECTEAQYQDYANQRLVSSKVQPASEADLLPAAAATRLAAITDACNATILEGFASKALGPEHRYPAKLTDQSNLQASVLASLFPGLAEDWTTPFWCQDAAGSWAYRPHTAAQIQQVGSDGKDAINACIAQKIQLEEQLAKTKTLAEVEAITWTAPQ